MKEKKCIICYQQTYILKDFIYCKNCFHIQLNTYKNNKSQEPQDQFVNDFGISSMLRYGMFNKYNKKDYNDPVELKILDINCINTNQLDVFLKMNKVCGFNLTTVGINCCEINCNNHIIYTDFIQETVNILKEKFNFFDIIIIQNDFENISDPHTFLKLCKQLMNDDTLLFIQSKTGIYDSTLNQLLELNKKSFYNTNSMSVLTKMCDLTLNRVHILNNNYVFEIINRKVLKGHEYQNVYDQLYKELEKNMYSVEFYENM
jgi:2-polyprenyl-3-methyl-5-hydroxy-6-metoxy-1,4-benzoquinol methylase